MEHFDIHHPTSPPSMSFLFHASMWWRIFYGFLRVVLGISLIHMTGESITTFIQMLMAHETTGLRTDTLLGMLYTFFNHYDVRITYFLAFYFIFWGVIDIVLSICLLKHILRAFPIAMALIALFIVYGIYRFTHTHSLMLICVIIFDIGMLFLINYEYQKLKYHLG